jgi:predicted molibdopterin-dependent oxidoreductase YjgC
MNVNKYWMCDYGRLSQYEYVNKNRITDPMHRINDELIKVSWDEIYLAIAAKLSTLKPAQIMFIGSPLASTEDNYLLLKFAKEIIKSQNLTSIRHNDFSFEDDFLRCSDMSPNTAGITAIQFDNTIFNNDVNVIRKKIQSGEIKALYILNENFVQYPDFLDSLVNLELLIVHSYNFSNLTNIADYVLAASTFAESEGTFINNEGLIQHFTPALVTRENMRIMGLKMSRLDKFGALNDRWTHHEQRNCRPGWKIIQGIAKLMGSDWNYKTAFDIFDEICSMYPAFNGMSYELLDEYQGLLLGNPAKPEKKEFVYESHFMKPD